jgi:hypothetical protein
MTAGLWSASYQLGPEGQMPDGKPFPMKKWPRCASSTTPLYRSEDQHQHLAVDGHARRWLQRLHPAARARTVLLLDSGRRYWHLPVRLRLGACVDRLSPRTWNLNHLAYRSCHIESCSPAPPPRGLTGNAWLARCPTHTHGGDTAERRIHYLNKRTGTRAERHDKNPADLGSRL